MSGRLRRRCCVSRLPSDPSRPLCRRRSRARSDGQHLIKITRKNVPFHSNSAASHCAHHHS